MIEPEIITHGRNNGEGVIVRYRTAKGTEVYGLPLPNIHGNQSWDLGPTWCYLVLGPKTILIDAGRMGNMDVLERYLNVIGKKLSDIEAVIVTHGHEDHDGQLAEVLTESHAGLWAHPAYGDLILYHPEVDDGAPHPEYPGSCRPCTMPLSYVERNCIPYHRKRSALSVDCAIAEDSNIDGFTFRYTPGHSPDSICITLDGEIVFTGDTVLPGITPHPSLARTYEVNRRVLPEGFRTRNESYGLMNYIKSLHKLGTSESTAPLIAFPAHRLFWEGRFNLYHTRDRVREIIQFHIDRCRAVLDIVASKPKSIEEIVVEHFTPSQLEGFGRLMARNEIMAHIEVMEPYGDVRWAGDNMDLVQRTGSTQSLKALTAFIPS
ncbi:MAG: MBL fold metallo-hydrolase [Chloroflexi bacterium]|nr:MBL fold metallo-hydrolase [Chloroflexota bacterium]